MHTRPFSQIQSHMSNDLTNFNVLTRLLVEMAAAVKLKHCEPIGNRKHGFCHIALNAHFSICDWICQKGSCMHTISNLTIHHHSKAFCSQPKAFCTIYSQESHDLTCLCYMWPLPFNRHRNRLTVHAFTIIKGSMVYFYWGLIHRPVWHPSVLGWSVNSSKFPGQADSWRESPQDWLHDRFAFTDGFLPTL